MYVEMTKNNGTDYLRLVRNDRILNSKGIKTSTKKVVYNIGPLSRFDDGQPDYVERLKKSFSWLPSHSSPFTFLRKRNSG